MIWRPLMHQTIQKVTEDIDQLKCNTAIAALMTLLNKVYRQGQHHPRRAAHADRFAEPLCPPCNGRNVGSGAVRRYGARGTVACI